jgi:hypothetical protein
VFSEDVGAAVVAAYRAEPAVVAAAMGGRAIN